IGDETDLYKNEITVCDLNWISMDNLTEPIEVTAKTRYSQNEQEATVCPMENGEVLVKFHNPQRAPAKGQAAVFYKGDVVLGGGTIK
ncbi:MAG: tRNA 2-thiouridine(34) synthase MnmA, partial [Oscillospiraceae bacterium]|nr:tRNA 2-thiouridine(34) synthase MnmA [Oscillospiraceae bacterium]